MEKPENWILLSPTNARVHDLWRLFDHEIQKGRSYHAQDSVPIELFEAWIFNSADAVPVTVALEQDQHLMGWGGLPFYSEWPAYHITREIVVYPTFKVDPDRFHVLFDHLVTEAHAHSSITSLIAFSSSADLDLGSYLADHGFQVRAEYPDYYGRDHSLFKWQRRV